MDTPHEGSGAPTTWTDPLASVTTAAAPEDRFMGVTSSLWNQKRSVTLVAGPEGCDLLLMKRLVLQKVVRQVPPFRARTAQRFLENELPALLAQNRFFGGAGVPPGDPFWRELAADPAVEWIHFLKAREASGLAVFAPPDSSAPLPARTVSPADLSGRLMIYPEERTADVAAPSGATAPGGPDGLYLILSGSVRMTRKLEGGEVLLRQHGRNGFFGLTADWAEAVTDVHVVRLGWGLVAQLGERFPAVGARLERQRRRLRELDQALVAGHYLSPEDPPEEVATKLFVATNLLRIDMDLCTRCDQCVLACAETHNGIPRFHRANPDLRFGKWEIPRACVHCSDAPCQVVCPVGAITFLEDGIVQIHHDRCIACQKCPSACPFDVIEMYPPDDPADAPNLADKKRDLGVATKCDRCLTTAYDPACVAACPYGASQRGSPLELFPDLRRWEGATRLEGG
jgi:Fe-S-cluster-containing dehydrogenase component